MSPTCSILEVAYLRRSVYSFILRLAAASCNIILYFCVWWRFSGVVVRHLWKLEGPNFSWLKATANSTLESLVDPFRSWIMSSGVGLIFAPHINTQDVAYFGRIIWFNRCDSWRQPLGRIFYAVIRALWCVDPADFGLPIQPSFVSGTVCDGASGRQVWCWGQCAIWPDDCFIFQCPQIAVDASLLACLSSWYLLVSRQRRWF